MDDFSRDCVRALATGKAQRRGQLSIVPVRNRMATTLKSHTLGRKGGPLKLDAVKRMWNESESETFSL